MIMDLLVTGTTVAVAYGAGFWLGKADRRLSETSAEKAEEKRVPQGRAIGSPATGESSCFEEGTRKGVKIRSSQGYLYAPASGKIVRLYPTGNRMLLCTEFGVELLLQAGIETGGLEGLYYRPRVVQNEVVNKGKLLLEYDPDAICREGYDPVVVMSVEDAADYRDITVTDAARVRSGEDVMWVRR